MGFWHDFQWRFSFTYFALALRFRPASDEIFNAWTTDARHPWFYNMRQTLLLFNFECPRNEIFLCCETIKKVFFPPRFLSLTQNFHFSHSEKKRKVLNDVDGTKILHFHYFPPLSADFPLKLYHHMFMWELNYFLLAHFRQLSGCKMAKKLIFDPEENFFTFQISLF